jgi:hypothetical protein
MSYNNYKLLKSKYFNNLPDDIGTTVIPAGTMLYRSSPPSGMHNGHKFRGICEYSTNIAKQKQTCTNTGRHGVFFGTYPLLALAMALEYDMDRELGVFKTLVDIPVILGKYSFRYKNPERYFKNITRGNNGRIVDLNGFITHVTPTNDEELSHFNERIYPIVDFTSRKGKHIEYDMEDFSEGLNEEKDGEVFITDDYILNNIKLIRAYNVDVEKLKKIVEDNIDDLSAYDLNMYRDALKRKGCKLNKNRPTRKHKKYKHYTRKHYNI